MRVRLTRRSLIAVAGVLFAIAGIAWGVAFRNSCADAVPAGAKHIRTVVPTAPDDAKQDPAANNFVSVTFMTRGYCYAGSPIADTSAPGGFARSDNLPHKVRIPTNANALYLLAQPGVATQYKNGPGMRVVLINQTRDLLAFAASDSRLAIIQEAKDADGDWKPVEYLPSSWCGNSYHRVFLPPAHFWAFSAPRYKGSVPTKLRFAMRLADGSFLYSNTFAGSVNPEQFTMKEGHNATNIMDPYND